MLQNVYRYIPSKYIAPLKGVYGNVQELRLRVGRAFAVNVNGVEKYLQPDGRLSESSNYGIVCTQQDVTQTFERICNYSVHSYSRELSQGYITLEGGNRVGFCGTYVFKGNELHTVRDISSINIRVSQAFRGCANALSKLLDLSTYPKGVLIVGKPLSAKTTILRDLCRIVSNRYKVSLIDERSEVASVYEGTPQSDVGLKVDIFDGYPKDLGINHAIRTMSPDIIFCDEIGTKQDFKALEWGSICGVKFICTAHADSIEQVLRNPNYASILHTSAFDYIALLGHGSNVGKVVDFKCISKE